MNKVRVISRLDIRGSNLIKGIHLEGLRVIGNPQEYATKYYDEIYNMPESIADIIKDSHKVGIYPISHNAWIDVGQWPKYNKAIEKI